MHRNWLTRAMQLLIAACGKWKRSPEKELFDAYAGRLHWPLTLKEVAHKPHADNQTQRTSETAALLDAAKSFSAHHIIALDEQGKHLTSPKLAEIIGRWQDAGEPKLACLVGGDVGLDRELLKACDMTIAFGAMTWPHLLARALLAEQLYRASTILQGHPYHRV